MVERQAALVAQWMLVGFVHGVMNTDNTTISGETIDYGPCAFIDAFDPAAVFSSIDQGGRYAFGNQPAVLKWNLARFAETLLRLISPAPDDAIAIATATLSTFDAVYEQHLNEGLSAKLGLADTFVDHELIDDLLALTAEHRADWTGTFRALADELRGRPAPLDILLPRDASDPWVGRWREALARHGRDDASTADAMDLVNPLYIPRNHLVDDALRAAHEGDLGPFEELLDVVTHPFERRVDRVKYTAPASEEFNSSFQTFCGT